MAVQDIPL